MKNSKEQGHEKNVANFNLLISECKSLGALYVPSNGDLTVDKLTDLATRAKATLLAQGTAKSELDLAVNARTTMFEGLPKLITRIFRAARSAKFSDKDLKDMQEHIRKIRGTRANTKVTKAIKDAKLSTTPPEGEPTAAPATVSVSQKGFDNQIKHLRELVDGLKINPLYKPNEESLKVETLTRLIDDMDAQNQKSKDAYVALFNLRQQRDALLYKNGAGLYDIVMAVKDYIMSTEDTPPSAITRIRNISFRRLD